MKDRNFTLTPHVLRSVRISSGHTIIAAYDPASSKARPGNGGTRWMEYSSVEEAEREARILAERMTVKHNIYKTGFRGAKIVICGPRNPETENEVLQALADFLNQFEGILYTGCDLNTTNADMSFLSELTPYILNSLSNPGVDTSSATGSGVFAAARSTIDSPFRADATRFAIHGLGKVGSQVALDSRRAGYVVAGFDLDPLKDAGGSATPVTEEALFTTPSDVLVLCSLSGVLTPEVADVVQTKWIVSAANAPMSDPGVIDILEKRGISYLPDVLANSGAVLCDALEWNSPALYSELDQEEVNIYVRRRVAARTSEAISFAEIVAGKSTNLTKALLSAWENAGEEDTLSHGELISSRKLNPV